MPLRSGRSYLASVALSDLLNDDSWSHILRMTDVTTMCTAKACSMRMSRLVRHELATAQFARRRSLARRESEVDNEDLKFNGPEPGQSSYAWITVFCRNGRERDVILHLRSDRLQLASHPLVEWLSTGPAAEELVGLQDWSIENAQNALKFVLFVWQEQWRPIGWVEGDEENNEALAAAFPSSTDWRTMTPSWEDAQDEAIFLRVLDTLCLWDDAILRARGAELFSEWNTIASGQFNLLNQDDLLRHSVMAFFEGYDRSVVYCSRLDLLEARARQHPTLINVLLHSDGCWLNDHIDDHGEYVLSCLLRWDDRQEEVGLRYVGLLDAAVCVDDALNFLSTADKESWPDPSEYSASQEPVGVKLRAWAEATQAVDDVEFVCALLDHCFLDWAGRTDLRIERVRDNWLVPLLQGFFRGPSNTTSATAITVPPTPQQLRTWLDGRDEPALSDALHAALGSTNAVRVAMQRHPRELPDEIGVLSLFSDDSLWPDEWRHGAC